MKLALVFLGGLLFGAGLLVSGMTDPSRVVAFLDFFGDWDPALAFVMGGAVFTFGIGVWWLRFTGKIIFGNELPDTSSDPISSRMVIGSAIFGIGWGLGGLCPGPAIANLSLVRVETLWFLPAMLGGMLLAQRWLKVDQ